MLARQLSAAFVVAALYVACGGDADKCAAGWTRICLQDGTTCTCAPPCTITGKACADYQLCGINHSCQPCHGSSGDACTCFSEGNCLPLSWTTGEVLTFEPLGGFAADGGDGGGGNNNGGACARAAVASARTAAVGNCTSIFPQYQPVPCGQDSAGRTCCCSGASGSGTVAEVCQGTSSDGCGYCHPSPAQDARYTTYCGTGGSRAIPNFCGPGEKCIPQTDQPMSATAYGCCPDGKSCGGVVGYGACTNASPPSATDGGVEGGATTPPMSGAPNP